MDTSSSTDEKGNLLIPDEIKAFYLRSHQPSALNFVAAISNHTLIESKGHPLFDHAWAKERQAWREEFGKKQVKPVLDAMASDLRGFEILRRDEEIRGILEWCLKDQYALSECKTAKDLILCQSLILDFRSSRQDPIKLWQTLLLMKERKNHHYITACLGLAEKEIRPAYEKRKQDIEKENRLKQAHMKKVEKAYVNAEKRKQTRQRMVDRLESASLKKRISVAKTLCKRAVQDIRRVKRKALKQGRSDEIMEIEMSAAIEDIQMAEQIFRWVAQDMMRQGASMYQRRSLNRQFQQACSP